MSYKILVFTRDKSVAASLQNGLEKRGFAVSATSNKQRMLSWTSEGRAEFLFVDASRSLEKGLEFCKQLRACDENARIILAIPDRRRLSPEVADAWFVAPVTLRKVRYRLTLLLQASPSSLIQVGDIALDPKNRIVRRRNQEAVLRPKEARLLQLLMEQAGTVVSREEIMKQVWDTEYTGDTRTIDVHIRWLRKKIEPVPGEPVYIRTARQRGYQFNVPATKREPSRK